MHIQKGTIYCNINPGSIIGKLDANNDKGQFTFFFRVSSSILFLNPSLMLQKWKWLVTDQWCFIQYYFRRLHFYFRGCNFYYFLFCHNWDSLDRRFLFTFCWLNLSHKCFTKLLQFHLYLGIITSLPPLLMLLIDSPPNNLFTS